MKADRVRAVLLAIAAVVLVGHSLVYNFVTDDAYISFVFARNFAEHGQLTFNLGQPVEGYTNFLWTLVIGLLMIVGVSPELSSRVLGVGCALATLYVVTRATERAVGKPGWAVVPALVLACSAGFACWTSGGLETQLFTLLCAIAIDGVVAAESDDAVAATRAMRRAGLALALAAMTRPEGVLVAAVLGAVRVACNAVARRRWIARPELVGAVAMLALWAPWFAWRWWYYGYPFPNTYYVKASGPWAAPTMAHEMWKNGAYYVWVWARQSGAIYGSPFVLLALATVRRATPRFALALACIALTVVYLAYAASVGGDFMGLHRFIMPVFVATAILVTLGLEIVVPRIPPQFARLRLALAFVAAAYVYSQAVLTQTATRPTNTYSDHGIDTPAFLIVYTEDRAAIGRAMASCFRDDDFSIVGGAGAQPYFGRMRGIDVFGLVSEKIAHDEPRIRARAGHTKFGSDPLLATYDPTFVFSCYEIHKTEKMPSLPCAGYWLARGYEQVTMHIPGMRQSGEYYTFLAKKSRAFTCPGRVAPAPAPAPGAT